MNKEIDLSVSCYGKTRELVYDLVLLPWGATEPHNLHLPYLTDCILHTPLPLMRQSAVKNCMVCAVW